MGVTQRGESAEIGGMYISVVSSRPVLQRFPVMSRLKARSNLQTLQILSLPPYHLQPRRQPNTPITPRGYKAHRQIESRMSTTIERSSVVRSTNSPIQHLQRPQRPSTILLDLGRRIDNRRHNQDVDLFNARSYSSLNFLSKFVHRACRGEPNRVRRKRPRS